MKPQGQYNNIETDKPKNKIERLVASGLPSYYVRFHQSVAPGLNKEPVNEFKTDATFSGLKYQVDSITWTEQGIIYKAYGEINIVPLANVIYCRLLVS